MHIEKINKYFLEEHTENLCMKDMKEHALCRRETYQHPVLGSQECHSERKHSPPIWPFLPTLYKDRIYVF